MADYSHLTIMYSLPRSMTQWWRWFFAHGCHSLHDPLARFRHPDKLKDVVDAADGERIFIADTSAVFFHERFERLFPGHLRIYMMRTPERVADSLRAQGTTPPTPLLYDAHDRLVRQAYNGPQCKINFGFVYDLPEWFAYVTGRTDGMPKDPLATHVDVPVRQQYRNVADIKSLLAYKDPT